MNKCSRLSRGFCIVMAVLMLLIFCMVGHDCHHDHCPVCLLAASFRMTLGLAALALGLACPHCWHCLEDVQRTMAGRGATLVALKVKLSD